MMFLGRRIIPTTLDPVPRPLRAVPGVLAINHLEQAALERGDSEVSNMLTDIVQAEDAADARLVLQVIIGERNAKLDPSTRMSMLYAAGMGRKR